ncbi:MAG: ABC transporter permease [Phycisphaerae bacterium]
MAYLPLANILHHKLRSVLSALGIGIGIAMLITLSGLARGSLYEIADRWESVDAELIMFPRGWGGQASIKSGAGLWDSYEQYVMETFADDVEEVAPVFTWPMELAGQDQNVAAIKAEDWQTFTGGKKVIAGRLFQPDPEKFTRLMKDKAAASPEGIAEVDQQMLQAANMLELVIDTRLARAGGFEVGQTVRAANHDWKIVGIVPAGVMARVFMPRRTAQVLFGSGSKQSTLMFIRLRDGRDLHKVARRIRSETGQDAVPLTEYRGMLVAKFEMMFQYVNMVNIVALSIAFLFIMVTLHTMVLQRTREIAILKSCGASWWFILKQVMAESVLLTMIGLIVGIGLSFLAAWAIAAFQPLLTVTITMEWLGIALVASVLGALLSAVYPAYRAIRVDMVAALSYE